MRHVTVDEKAGARKGGDLTSVSSSWYWLLTRNRTSGLDVFTQRTPGGAVVLPVFGSAEDARAYLATIRGPWMPRKTGRGELVSVLMGVCREAGWVVLDPPPGVTVGKALELLGMSRHAFLDPLIGRGRAWFQQERERQRT